MKKRKFDSALICLFAIFSVFILSAVVAADTNNGTNITVNYQQSTADIQTASDSNTADKSYQCLESEIGNRSDLSLQEAVFAQLALGYKKNLDDIIKSNKKENEACWPKSGCTLKDTAIVGLLYNRIGEDTKEIEKWIISKNSTLLELNWYLEIDISKHVQAECTLKYDTTERRIKIKDDMKIEGDPGSCLESISSEYWLKIRSNCYGKIFQVSCTEDFITTLLYTKSIGDTIYVSSSTHSSPASGTTKEQITAKCLKTGSVCDYEGSLWAVLFLEKLGNDVSQYLPYLVALAKDNPQFFPSTFIYQTAGGEDNYNDILQSQKQGRFWEVQGTKYNKFYDTSLAMLALYGSPVNQIDSAKAYLLGIRTEKGCWNNNNIRDTAFLLYSGWPKNIQAVRTASGTTLNPCEPTYSCETLWACSDAEGNVLDGFSCSGTKICCSVKVQEQTCTEKRGIVCAANQRCDGRLESSLDGSCCVEGSCINEIPEETCTSNYDGLCRTSCGKDEKEETGGICAISDRICCIKEVKSSGTNWTLIIILLLLIILVILAIIYRNKLRVWWFTYRGKLSSSPVKKPGMPPSSGMTEMMRRPMPLMQPPMHRPPMQKPLMRKDSEMDETLKKLREMAK